jgi:hypothetical protein
VKAVVEEIQLAARIGQPGYGFAWACCEAGAGWAQRIAVLLA